MFPLSPPTLALTALLCGPAFALQSSFGPEQVITTDGDGAWSVFVADLDGDGDVDVLSGSANDHEVSWVENLGQGTFGQRTIIGSSYGVRSVRAADLDGDGDQDVLAASAFDDEIAWFENLGGGQFGPKAQITTSATYAWEVFTADLDGDGDLDVLSASTNDAKIAWYRNEGGGVFGGQNTIAFASGARAVHAADLDGDGDVDVLSTAVFIDRVAWYENQGGGSFSSPKVLTTTMQDPNAVIAADVDGDGDLDVVATASGDDLVAWFENLGGGNFSAAQTITTAANGARDVVAADLDADGDLDLVSTSTVDDTIAWYENQGTGTFGTQQVISTNADFALEVRVADIDGDSDLDVVSVSSIDSKVAWYASSLDPTTEIVGLSPSAASWWDTTLVTVTTIGKALIPNQPATVTFEGEVPLVGTATSTTEVQVTIPADFLVGAGLVDVTVSQAGADSVLADGFTVLPSLVADLSGDSANGGVVDMQVTSGLGGFAYIYMAAAKSPVPIALPGIHGALELDFATTVSLGAGGLLVEPTMSIPFAAGYPAGSAIPVQGLVVEFNGPDALVSFTESPTVVIP